MFTLANEARWRMESYKTPAECLITHACVIMTIQAKTKIAQFFYGNRRDMTLSIFYETE